MKRYSTIALLVAVLFVQTSFAAEPIDIGTRLEPLVDRYLIESLSNCQLRLHRPVPREIAIVHDEAWEGNICAYHTVFQDGDIYRMYYRGAHSEKNKTRSIHQVVCYAESKDGIHFTKPNLGIVEFNGSKKNNIILKGFGVHNFAPFRDTNPNCKPGEQYKAVASGAKNGKTGLFTFKSSDAIHWTLISDKPIITKGAFDSQNLAFFDNTRNRYVDFHRQFRGVRDIMTCTSADFINWTEPEFLTYPGAPKEHLYTNQITPYYRAPHIFFGFPKRFVPSRNPTGHFGSGVSDGLFMTSRDGKNFHRWGEAIIRPGLQRERWVNRNNMTAWGIVETKSAIAGTPNEMSIYSSENYYQGAASKMRRYTCRLDGFVSVEAPLAGGELKTKLITFGTAGSVSENSSLSKKLELVINFSTSAAGQLRCELIGAEGKPIPGFTLADCDEIYGDDIARTISWKNQSNLSDFIGKPVHLRFLLKDANLYSLRFR